MAGSGIIPLTNGVTGSSIISLTVFIGLGLDFIPPTSVGLGYIPLTVFISAAFAFYPTNPGRLGLYLTDRSYLVVFGFKFYFTKLGIHRFYSTDLLCYFISAHCRITSSNYLVDWKGVW